MLKTTLYNYTGEKKGTFDLPKDLFASKVNDQLMAQAIRVFLSNQRSSQAKSKTRSEIKLTKSKWYKQKGTGRARHGAKSAPIFVGGSKAHGPTGAQNYQLKLTKKMKISALKSALTSKNNDKQIFVVENLNKVSSKTQNAQKFINKLKLSNKKITIITPEKIEEIWRAFRNIPKTEITLSPQVSTYKILNGGTIIFTTDAITKLISIFTKQPPTKAASKPAKNGDPAKKTKKIETKTSKSKK